jgi:cytochrome c-type biogenesis protein CcmH/NrfG
LLLFLSSTRLFAGAGKSDSLVAAAWKAWEKNGQSQVEQMFLAAVQADPKNARAHLGLSFLYAYQEKHKAAWLAFKNILQTEENIYPYIYSAWLTPKLRRSLNNPKAGAVELLQNLAKQADAAGILKAMANDVLGEHYQSKGDLNKSRQFYQNVNAIKDWMLIGPFENVSASGFENVYPPELAYDAAKTYPGKNGLPAKWFKIAATRNDGWIDHRRYFSYLQAVYYGNNFVYSPKKQPVQIRLGTSGSLKAFLNDELLIEYFDENNNDLDTYIVATELQEGWNRLLIKCGFSEINQCNFLVRVTDERGEAIPGLKIATEAQKYASRPGAPAKVVENFAEAFFQQKIKENPQHLENYLLLADCYLRNDKAIEAELALREAIKRSPQCALLYNAILEAYLRGEKYDEQATTVEKILALDKNCPSALKDKISKHLENEDFDQSEELIQRLAAVLPESETVYEQYIALYSKKKQIDKVIELNAKALKQYPANWGFAYLEAAIAIATTRKYDRAIEIIKNYLAEQQTTTALTNLADIYLQASDVGKWQETYQKALALDPAATGFYYRMATTYTTLQDYGNAEKAIKRALEICSTCSDYWAKLGEIYRIENKIEPSKQAYREALNCQSTNYEAREALRELEGKKSIFSQFAVTDVKTLIKNSPPAEDYPNDGGAILLHDAKHAIYERGAAESAEEVLVKVFSNAGIDAFKEYWIGYNSYLESLTIEKAVVIKKDGAEIEADVRDNHVVFKSLEKNDFIYLKWRLKKYYSGKLASHFWDTFYFNGFYPCLNVRYALLVPEGFKFQFKGQNMPAEPVKTTTADGVLYQWSATGVPAIEYEYGMPPLDDVGKVLHISSIANWEYLVEWYSDLARTKTRASYEIKEQVARLFDGKPNLSEEEKIEAIYHFITENIRYSSVPFRQSALTPQKARNVLVNKIGDCKDVATLCIAMLDAAGIKAHYVLVNTRNEGQNKNVLPSISFNHCLTGVETKAGVKYLDLTAYNYPFGSVPAPDVEGFSLLMKPGVKAPDYLPRHEFMSNNILRQTKITVRQDLGIAVNVHSRKIGAPGAWMRNDYRDLGQKEREKRLAESLSGDFPNVVLNKFDMENLDGLAPAVRYAYEYEVPNYVTETGQFLLLKMHWADGFGADQALSYDQRNFPYEIGWAYADSMIEEIEMALPAGYAPVDLPPSVKLTSAFADYAVNYSFAAGRLNAKRELVVKKTVVPPEAYAEFKKFYNSIVKEDARQILLKK